VSSAWQFTNLFYTIDFTKVPNQAVTLLLDIGNGAISVNVIPEPATAILLGLGGLVVLAACRRR
jgi:hypothetical protein